MILGILADIFLCFNQQIIIVPVITIGYWCYRRDFFAHLLFLILLSMIVNAFLKGLFQVPLKPHLNQHGWYAFPSGHMQLSTVFYGWLWWELRKKKWAHSLLLLLVGMGWAMIWKNYHDLSDILGGCVAGVGLLILYKRLLQWDFVEGHTDKMGFLLLPLTAVLIFFTPSIPLKHIWQAQGGLLGFSIGAMLLKKYGAKSHPAETLAQRVLITSIGLGGFGGLHYVTSWLLSKLSYPWFPFCSFFVLGLWLSMGADFAGLFLKRKRESVR